MPANTLLVMNGEDVPQRRVYAVDPGTGAVLASVAIPTSDPVGLSYHAGALLADIPVLQIEVTSMSGIAWDDATGTAWISTTPGTVLQVVGITP